MITIVPCPVKGLPKIRAAVDTLLDQLQFKIINPRIMIKPNIVDAIEARSGVITDPILVEALILALKDRGATDFVIAEGTGFFNKPEHFAFLLKETGYQKMVEDLQQNYQLTVPLINLEFAERDEYSWEHGTVKLPKLLKTHTYINLAKMKTHSQVLVTLGTKNQKGLLLFEDKKKFHLGYGGKSDLNRCITELANIIQPELTLIDALWALEGNGPIPQYENQTKARKIELLIGGTSMTEVDTAGTILMGFSPNEVIYLPKIEVSIHPNSLPLKSVEPPFMRPKPTIKYGNIFLHCPLWACTGCQISFVKLMRKFLLSSDLTPKFYDLQKKYARIDFFIGKTTHENIPGDHGILIFMGQCTKKIAEELGAIHLEGCPGDYNKAIQNLISQLI